MTCKICYENQKELITKCGHQFCLNCIREWMNIQNICPYCRSDLNYNQIIESYIYNCPKRINRSLIAKIKNKFLQDEIAKYLNDIAEEYNYERKIKIYEAFNKFLYKNRYYLKKIEQKLGSDNKFVKVIIQKTLYISKDYIPSYYWHVKFRDYFLIK